MIPSKIRFFRLWVAVVLGGLLSACASWPYGQTVYQISTAQTGWTIGQPHSYVFASPPTAAGVSTPAQLNAQGHVERDIPWNELTVLQQASSPALSEKGFSPAAQGTQPDVWIDVSENLRERWVWQPDPWATWHDSLELDGQLSAPRAPRETHQGTRLRSHIIVSIGASTGRRIRPPSRLDEQDPFKPDPVQRPVWQVQREFSLRIRDARTQALLYETHILDPHAHIQSPFALQALWRSALSDFPRSQAQPQAIWVDLRQPPSPSRLK